MNHRHIETELNLDEHLLGAGSSPSVPPLYQNTFFSFPDYETAKKASADPEAFTYSRIHNPTVAQAEEKLAALSDGEEAILFSSGMGAISAAVLHCVHSGGHIVSAANVNMPIRFLFRYLSENLNISVTYVDGHDPADFEQNLTEQTSLFYLESPTSEDYRILDLPAIAKIAGQHKIFTILDNTWSTPLFQKPLALGIDLEVASCSKYLGGHSDLVSGVIIGESSDIRAIRSQEYSLFGAKMAPAEAWLLLRSLRTLPLRMAKHQENAQIVARFLNSHPKVAAVLYPGLDTDPDHERSRQQMSGYSGRFTAVLATEDPEAVKRFLKALTCFHFGVSWGGHESQVYYPGGSPVGSLRFSIGLENADDLILDLAAALEQV